VDLAWDTVVRFSPARLPRELFDDFARVADDESRHLRWCLQRLEELGHPYGSMPAHNILWEGAQHSSSAVTDRLVVIPLIQEARGLDAGPRLADRMVGCGDNRSAAIVRRISEEELAHVAVGVAWLTRLCEAQSVQPGDAFREVVSRLYPEGVPKGAYNVHAREKVGLPQEWYAPDALHGRLSAMLEGELQMSAV
jgi:uncharacterized ferritin-like protein (DUF455 family)